MIEVWFLAHPNTNIKAFDLYEPRSKKEKISAAIRDELISDTNPSAGLGDDQTGFYRLIAGKYKGASSILRNLTDLKLTERYSAAGAQKILEKVKEYHEAQQVAFDLEEQISNKLKPLIKEMLTKGK